MANDALFLELAKALARPSKAYQAATAAIDVPDQAIQGYMSGSEMADKLQERKFNNQSLSEALGGNVPSYAQDYSGLKVRQFKPTAELLGGLGSIQKANTPPERNDTLENILTEKVRTGQMTMDQAAAVKRSMSPGMSIKPPPGFQFGPDGNSLIPIPGGDPALKRSEDEAKKQAAADAQRTEADLVIKKIDDTLGQVNGLSAGGMAGTAKVPIVGQMTGATDLASNLDTITSSLGLNKLMEMKANSKAGASGMGQLSDREMNLLTSALTSVKQSQSPEQLRQHLGDVKRHYQNILQMNQGVNPFGSTNPPLPNSDNKSSPKTAPADPLGLFN